MSPSQNKQSIQSVLLSCKNSFIFVGGISGIVNILMLVPAIYMLQVYDRVVASSSIETLMVLTFLMVFLLFVMGGLEWARSRILIALSANLERKTAFSMFMHSQEQAQLTNGSVNNAQPLRDLNGVKQFLSSHATFAFFDIPWTPVYIWVMWLFHPYFGMVGILSAMVLLALTALSEARTNELLTESNNASGQSWNKLIHQLSHPDSVHAMGMKKNLYYLWQKETNIVSTLQHIASLRAGSIQAITKTFRLTIQSLVLGLGAYLAIHQEISPGVMIAGSILLGRALAPIDQSIGAWKQFVNARQQFKRLRKLNNSEVVTERIKHSKPLGKIDLQDVNYSPQMDGPYLIDALSLRVEEGCVVGIIGPSGAGKTTLGKLILGLLTPNSGVVRIDGEDVKNWDSEELGSYLGYLSQEMSFYQGTVAQNIARFGEINSEMVIDTAKAAGVHELIQSLPQGYDTPLGPNGINLSGGQKQRIGLARAMYGKPAVIVLDEPNANTDNEGELALINAIKNAKRAGITIFLISHKPSVIQHVDKILIMKNGKVAQWGDAKQILSRMASADSH